MSTKFDLYQTITDKFIDEMKKGIIPWKRDWRGAFGAPRNFATKKPYRGINVFLLYFDAQKHGYKRPEYLTFKQCADLGGSIKAGSKSTIVVFWKLLKKEETDPKTGQLKKKTIQFLKYYNVFNVEQTTLTIPEEPVTEHVAAPKAEETIKSYLTRETIAQEAGNPAYCPSTDSIRMPNLNDFEHAEEYYSAYFHEMTHSTGPKKRLARFEIGGYVHEEYAKEELVAEIGASFLMADHELTTEFSFKNSTAYLQNWISALKNDPKLIICASGKAQLAADYIYNGKKKEEDAE